MKQVLCRTDYIPLHLSVIQLLHKSNSTQSLVQKDNVRNGKETMSVKEKKHAVQRSHIQNVRIELHIAEVGVSLKQELTFGMMIIASSC